MHQLSLVFEPLKLFLHFYPMILFLHSFKIIIKTCKCNDLTKVYWNVYLWVFKSLQYFFTKSINLFITKIYLKTSSFIKTPNVMNYKFSRWFYLNHLLYTHSLTKFWKCFEHHFRTKHIRKDYIQLFQALSQEIIAKPLLFSTTLCLNFISVCVLCRSVLDGA